MNKKMESRITDTFASTMWFTHPVIIAGYAQATDPPAIITGWVYIGTNIVIS